MARQRIHNRRAGRGSMGGGASWISYSDMMAALLLIFVLILAYSLYQYFTMLDSKTKELNEQQILLDLARDDLNEKEQALIVIRADLDDLKANLDDMKAELDEKDKELIASNLNLVNKVQEADALQALLLLQQSDLDVAKQRLQEQQIQINDLAGIRTTIIQDLSQSLSAANLKATVDPTNGDIILDSSVFFETNRSTIRPEGKELLDRFIPVYLSVLMSPEYDQYVGEIIIEGHTDSQGSYESNLKLSQDRALQVALYCLNLPSLTPDQKTKLQQILTAKGRSESNLIYDANGNEDAEASRRVEFKFSIKDSYMIDKINEILSDPVPEE